MFNAIIVADYEGQMGNTWRFDPGADRLDGCRYLPHASRFLLT